MRSFPQPASCHRLLSVAFFAAVLAGLCWSRLAVAIAPSQLSNAETTIIIDAGTQAPKLLQLSLRDGNKWENSATEPLPDHVQIHGTRCDVSWRFNRSASIFSPHEIRLVYDSQTPRLRLWWEWRARGMQGPLEHTIRVENLSDKEIWLPLLSSLRFDWQVDPRQPLERFWVEKGAGTPSAEGTHLDPFREADTWSGTSSTYADPPAKEPREFIPYLLVQQANGQRKGWYIGIEFSGRTRITVGRRGASVYGEAGLNPDPAPGITHLAPEESFETPAVFLGTFSGGPDAAGNQLRRWVRAVLNNPLTVQNPSYPFMASNTWGFGEDRGEGFDGMNIDEAESLHMIDEAAQLGLELFHVDAGWFRAVGDWSSNSKKFSHGVSSIADYAHKSGLKFGLWTDWTQAGISTEPGALNVHNPGTVGWLTAIPPPDWTPGPFIGITIDIGLPAAHDWAAAEVDRIVREYHLDMLEHDGYLVAKSSIRSGANDTDVSYHATRAYYDIQSRLRQQHPGILLEICNNGGRMVDFGSAAHGDYFSITDTYDPLSNRRAFFDASYVLPPAMLESYVERWPVPRIENLRYMLRSGMMGWFSLMFDPASWTPEQRAVAHDEFALYKSQLRPLIRDADLYHVSARPDGVRWDGIEYFDAKQRRGVLYAFRGSVPDEATHGFVFQGLDPERSYRVIFHDRGPSTGMIVSGQVLMQDGLNVALSLPLSSELVFIEEVHPSSK